MRLPFRDESRGDLALSRRAGQYRPDLREDRADAGSDTGHDRARCHRNESRHQRIFDEILTVVVLPYFQLQEYFGDVFHKKSIGIRQVLQHMSIEPRRSGKNPLKVDGAVGRIKAAFQEGNV